MPDIQRPVFFALSAIILFGTIYSVLYGTYLDTSDPLLTHLPHPLGTTHYFASKTNVLNVYFIKKAWGWTTAIFLFSWLTSPREARKTSRLLTYFALTGIWILFTNWFFGPAIFERVILASGGQCVLPGPLGAPIIVPNEYCFTRSTVSAASHPELFQTLATVEPKMFCPPHSPDCLETLKAVPRLRQGHDVSGHLFIPTMSTLLLADQLEASFRSKVQWSQLHTISAILNGALLAIWLLATVTTSIYFHSPMEKLTGYVLGFSAYLITQLPEYISQPWVKQPNLTTISQELDHDINKKQ